MEKGLDLEGFFMKKTWRLAALMVLAVFLAGCQGRVFLNLDVPIVVEPASRYRAEVWGYLSYDPYDEYIRYTVARNPNRHYRPLSDAKVTIVGTGMTVYTDRDGYFFLRGVPQGRLTLHVQHRWVGLRSGVYINTSSR
jgi:hypothetical protein